MTVSRRRNPRKASAAASTTTGPPTPISTGLSPVPSSLVAADVGVSVAAGWSGVGKGVSPSVGIASGVGVGVALEDGADVGVALGDDVRAGVDRDVGVGDSVSFEANVRTGVGVRFGRCCRASTPLAWPSHVPRRRAGRRARIDYRRSGAGRSSHSS